LQAGQLPAYAVPVRKWFHPQCGATKLPEPRYGLLHWANADGGNRSALHGSKANPNRPSQVNNQDFDLQP